MEYKTDKRTKNLTLRDIHIGDWVQAWSEQTERYSPPLKITQICDDGTVYLIIDEENRLEPWEENIKDIDALPIDGDLLKGFGFDISTILRDSVYLYQNVRYRGRYIGQIIYLKSGKCTFYACICGYECEFMHELANFWYQNHVDIKLEWKGVEK